MQHHSSIEPAGTRRVTVMQGQALASADHHEIFTTVLGSCISTCMFDPVARVGGMNHFLLSEPPANRGRNHVDEHYGAYLMEVLINEMLRLGALKSRMKAHLYGGANMHSGMAQIGTANVHFAERFLEQERIPVVHAHVGGVEARRVDFMPALGRARCRTVAATAVPAPAPVKQASRDTSGDVELF